MRVVVSVHDTHMGSVVSDIAQRGGHVLDVDVAGEGRTPPRVLFFPLIGETKGGGVRELWSQLRGCSPTRSGTGVGSVSFFLW